MTPGTTVCIDEPDNFVATREIQPWLTEIKDRCLEGSGQALLISHHPEIVDYLGAAYGTWVERGPNAPTRLHSLAEKGSHLKLPELVARGWVSE